MMKMLVKPMSTEYVVSDKLTQVRYMGFEKDKWGVELTDGH